MKCKVKVLDALSRLLLRTLQTFSVLVLLGVAQVQQLRFQQQRLRSASHSTLQQRFAEMQTAASPSPEAPFSPGGGAAERVILRLRLLDARDVFRVTS